MAIIMDEEVVRVPQGSMAIPTQIAATIHQHPPPHQRLPPRRLGSVMRIRVAGDQLLLRRIIVEDDLRTVEVMLSRRRRRLLGWGLESANELYSFVDTERDMLFVYQRINRLLLIGNYSRPVVSLPLLNS